MKSLDLHVKERIFIDNNLAVVIDPLSQLSLIGELDRIPFRVELFIISVLLQLLKQRHI